MKNIGYPDTKNKQSSSPLYSTGPKKKKKKKVETIHLDNVDVYGDKLSGSINMKSKPVPKDPGPKKSREGKDLPGTSKSTRQTRKTQEAREEADRQIAALNQHYAKKEEGKVERQKRRNIKKEVKEHEKTLQAQTKAAKKKEKAKRKKK